MKLSELIENLNKIKESNGDIEVVFESEYDYSEPLDMYEFNELFLVTAYNTLLIDRTKEL